MAGEASVDAAVATDASRTLPPELSIGTAAAAEDGAFTPLATAGEIPLETFGQGASHVELLLQVEGLGQRVWIDVTLRNLDQPDDPSLQVRSVDTGEPEPLDCTPVVGGMRCLRGPLLILTTGLAAPHELDGLHVEVIAQAITPDGTTAEDRVDAYLRRP
jgi:hypothetical protein